MGAFVRGLIGKSLLAVLGVSVLLAGYVVFIEFPSDQTFWKIAGTFLVLAIMLTLALISSLTLTTRYMIVGVFGIAAAMMSMVNGIFNVWKDDSSRGLTDLATAPSEALTGYVSSGDGVGSAVMLVIALVTISLPVINVVLYFSYQSNPLGEVLGLATVAAMLALIVMTGVATATGDTSEAVTKWTIFLGFFSTAGSIGTIAASSFDSERYSGATRHYDIQSDELPSALPQSFQPKPVVKEVPVQEEESSLPDFEYPSTDRN